MSPEVTSLFKKNQLPVKMQTVTIDRGDNTGPERDIVVPADFEGTPLSKKQLPEEELYPLMMQRVDKGKYKRFDNYPHDAEILSSEVYDAEKDPFGNERLMALVYLRGNHYQDEAGMRIDKERAWNGIEDETRTYIEVTTNLYSPGEVFARVIPYGKNDYHSEEQFYQKVQKDGKKSKHLQHIDDVVERCIQSQELGMAAD